MLCARVIGLGQARLGRLEQGRQRLERALEAARKIDNPVIVGAIHEALAELALSRGDLIELRRQTDSLAAYYVPTENPVLIARWQRMTHSARAIEVLREPAPSTPNATATRLAREPAKELGRERDGRTEVLGASVLSFSIPGADAPTVQSGTKQATGAGPEQDSTREYDTVRTQAFRSRCR